MCSIFYNKHILFQDLILQTLQNVPGHVLGSSADRPANLPPVHRPGNREKIKHIQQTSINYVTNNEKKEKTILKRFKICKMADKNNKYKYLLKYEEKRNI